MKKIFTLCLLSSMLISAMAQKTLHDYTVVTIDGDTIDLSIYKGKKLMVVNTASYCAYTPQFAQLEQLYTQYKQYNFEILGFPCNDFGSQDPGSDSTISHFCLHNYGVTFQMMSKIATVSQDTAPVYKWLQHKNLNKVKDTHVTWNFNKYLIDEAGHWVKYYDSPILPTDPAITAWIKSPSVLTGVQSFDKENNVVLSSDPSLGTSVDLIVKTSTPEHYTINIYSPEGRLVSNLYNGVADDQQKINFNYASLAAGIYFIRVQSGENERMIKYAVVK